MKLHLFNSNSGLGIIQAIAGLLIVSVASVGLFISAHYSRARANLNHQYRLASLKANDELEKIKWQYPDYGANPEEISYYTYNFVLDEINKPDFEATLIVEKKIESELSISPDAKKAIIIVKIEWEESYDIYQLTETITRSIALRDDYFYRVVE